MEKLEKDGTALFNLQKPCIVYNFNMSCISLLCELDWHKLQASLDGSGGVKSRSNHSAIKMAMG